MFVIQFSSLIRDNQLDYKFGPCLFIGYTLVHLGYKCIDKMGLAYISRHVQFEESILPFYNNKSASNISFSSCNSFTDTEESSTNDWTQSSVPLFIPLPVPTEFYIQEQHIQPTDVQEQHIQPIFISSSSEGPNQIVIQGQSHDHSIPAPPASSSDKIIIVEGLKAPTATPTTFATPATTQTPSISAIHVSQSISMATHGMVTHSKSRSYENVLLASTADVAEATCIHIALQFLEWREGIQK